MSRSGAMRVAVVVLWPVVFSPAAIRAAVDFDVVRDGQAAGDGTTDDTQAFQKVMDRAAAAGGGVVHVPAGHYRIAGNLRIPGAVTLQGTFRVPPADQREDRPRLDGSVLLAFAGRGSPDGPPFIRLAGSMATLAGFMITYPQWKQTDVPPVPYPPTVLAEGGANAGVIDCCFLNSYEAMRFAGATRHLVRNVHGYPSFRGLYIDACYDISRVENCHFWPFGTTYKPGDPYSRWVNENATAFEFARTDWQYVTNTFCFGYGVGYKFSASRHGPCNGNFLGIGADSCRRAVLVEDCQPSGLLITNGEFVGRWESTDSVGIEIAPGCGEGRISLTNCAFWGPLDRCVWSRSPRAMFTAANCHFVQWDVTGRGAPAVEAEAGRLIVQGSTFGSGIGPGEGDLHVRVGPQVRSAIILGNQAEGGVAVENLAGAATQLVANEAGPAPLPEAARGHYRLTFGETGDRPFLRRWYGPETAGFWTDAGTTTMRWSTAESFLRLPVLPGREYAGSIEIWMPEHAITAEAGIYLGQTRLAPLPPRPGTAVVTFTVPAADAPEVTLLLRAKGWRPIDLLAGSRDGRTLGVAVRRLTMKARDDTGPLFSANDGREIPATR